MDGGVPVPAKSTYFLARWLFLRGLALVFAVAFLSYFVQVDGLVGSRGILPIAEFLARVRAATGRAEIAELPTLCWFAASDASLHAQCIAGLLISTALFLGYAPRACLVLLWALYLSLAVAGQDFLWFQWDALLLETALFAIPFAPGRWTPDLAREQPPSAASLLLLRWLLFRLMFASGVVKLTSGDPSWGFSDLSALTFHWWSQPLPTVFGWYAAQMPLSLQRASCAVMYAIEIGFPWLAFGTRRMRRIACAGLVFLQLVIALTGNYGFFNLLSIVLCVALLDDALLARLVPRALAERAQAPRDLRRAPLALRIAGLALAGFAVLFTGAKLLENVGLVDEIPGALVSIDACVAPCRSLSDYGLFRVMTKQRREIEIQGSDDGVEWKPYPFRWKPGDVERPPAWCAPHMPRLDWQMWFAALAPAQRSRWLAPLVDRLLEGSPDVLDLFAANPFAVRPPRAVRAVLYDYRFTSGEEHAATGAWWKRTELGTFLPPRFRR